jgi:hypothetical protein
MDKEFEIFYWNELKSKLKQKYPQLTDADLLRRYNTNEEMLTMIALKLRKTNKELQEIIEKDLSVFY